MTTTRGTDPARVAAAREAAARLAEAERELAARRETLAEAEQALAETDRVARSSSWWRPKGKPNLPTVSEKQILEARAEVPALEEKVHELKRRVWHGGVQVSKLRCQVESAERAARPLSPRAVARLQALVDAIAADADLAEHGFGQLLSAASPYPDRLLETAAKFGIFPSGQADQHQGNGEGTHVELAPSGQADEPQSDGEHVPPERAARALAMLRAAQRPQGDSRRQEAVPEADQQTSAVDEYEALFERLAHMLTTEGPRTQRSILKDWSGAGGPLQASQAKVRSVLARALSEGRLAAVEAEVKRKNGSTYPAELVALPTQVPEKAALKEAV